MQKIKNLTRFMILGIVAVLTILLVSCVQGKQTNIETNYARSYRLDYKEIFIQTSPDTPTLKRAYLSLCYNQIGYVAYLYLTDIPVEFVIFDKNGDGKIDSGSLYIIEREETYLNTRPYLIPGIGFKNEDYNETEYYRVQLLLDQVYPYIKAKLNEIQ